jgi:hypothetical protein
MYCFSYFLRYTGYFTSDNDPDGIENATHNTFANQSWTWVYNANVLWVAFSIPSGSLSLVILFSCIVRACLIVGVSVTRPYLWPHQIG